VSGFAILLNLLFTETVHHHLQESLAGSNITLDGNLLVTRDYFKIQKEAATC
jgi:hypothetical protein